MAYQVLARKYRPQRLSDVAGQAHVTQTLLSALAQGRVAHGYIFSGHRGIGKTTVARILAMALNCHTPVGDPERPDPEPCGACLSCQEIRAGNAVDMLEIDAATNRGIDEIRELRDAARYRPSRDRYKIYLLDEAHQITDAAFNALLKTLEEPPDHVIFMMATTQPEDIPQTIRSRCQHFSFHAVKFEDIVAQLRQIAGLEGIAAEDGALSLLAEAGDGSMRDALSIMDQAMASAPIEGGGIKLEAHEILKLLGNVPNNVFERILENIHSRQIAEVMQEANRLIGAGNSPSQIARQFVRYLRNCLMAKLGGEATQLLQISADERARAVRSAAFFSEEDLTRFLQVMLRTFDELNYRQEQRFHLELGLIKLVHLERLIPLEQVLSGLPGASRSRQKNGGGNSEPVPGVTPGTGARAPVQSGPPAAPAVGEKSSPASRPASGGLPPASAIASTAPNSSPAQAVAATFLQESGPSPRDAHQTAEPVSLDRARDAVTSALDAKGHHTAAAILAAGRWSWEPDGPIRAEVGMKKTMLDLTVTAEAWKIIRDALRAAGAMQKMTIASAETIDPVPAPRKTNGSIQALALENPLVQRAQELFHAEVRSVVDLRENSRGNSTK